MRTVSQLDPFSRIITNRERGFPAEAGAFEFTTQAQDGVRIEGWGWKPDEHRGTVFLLHGFTAHCGNPETCNAALGLAGDFSLGLMAFDFRHHGRSGDRSPTFGTAEMWDFQSVLSEAERMGFNQPFIAIGDSLGAMAAQRTAVTDARIRGAFLMHPPGWPFDALGVCVGLSTPLAAAYIMAVYRWNILVDGDVRRHCSHPPHEPIILYIMGDEDHYGSHKTREVYEHWYRGIPEMEGFLPCQESKAKKWFVHVPGATHPGSPNVYHVWNWAGYADVLRAFVTRCLVS